MNCTIVIAAYNRKKPLIRLLNCISNANYKSHTNIKLIISIDRASNHKEMQEISEDFTWEYGEKIVVIHPERLGLKKHFIYCGDLSQIHGPIIFLEDDIFVNENYYINAVDLTNRYISSNNIAGVSLYSLRFNETAQRPFSPLEDGNDIFFCQLMSWAPVYFPDSWKRFKNWYSNHEFNNNYEDKLPSNVKKWKESSFKKKHIQFMIENDEYFVYPRISSATNFGEPGEHYMKNTDTLQVSLGVGNQSFEKLVDLKNSLSVYDAFMEIKPEVLKKTYNSLAPYDFETDLYGTKNLNNITSTYVLTSKKNSKPELEFGRKMVPHEVNIINNIKGQDFFLVKKTEIYPKRISLKKNINDVLYDQNGSTVLKIIINDLMWAISAVVARLKK